MKITRQERDHKGKFVANVDGVQAGMMTYTWAGNEKFIIDHTEVDPAFGGQGLGKKLVLAGADFARERGVKVIPLCPYAKKVFERDESLKDLMD